MKSNLFILCWIVGISLSGIAVADNPTQTDVTSSPTEKALAPLPTDDMRVAAYTREFAQRFGLPAPADDMIPEGGLLAVEFRIEKHELIGMHHYTCNWRLYIDDLLPVDYPHEGKAGKSNMFNGHFFETKRPGVLWPNEEDRIWHSRNWTSYARRIQISTSDYEPNRQGARDSATLTEFIRQLVPGVSYVETDNCDFAQWLATKPRDIVIWLKKGGTPDDRVRLRPLEDFHRFVLPRGLLEKARPFAEQATARNKPVSKAYAEHVRTVQKRYREEAAQQQSIAK